MTDLMRILHVITRLLRGGAEEKTFLEMEQLRDDHEYAVASGPSTDPRSVLRLAKFGVPHHIAPALRHYAPWSAPRAIVQLRRIIRAGRYDVVHTHSTEAGILGREAARRERVRAVVHTIHGMEFSDAHPWPIRRAVISLHRRLAPSTDLFLSNADILTRRFLAAGIGRPEQYVLVRSAVPFGASNNPGSLEGSPAVLTACRLEKGKGVDEILQAVAGLRTHWPGLRLSIAGDGPQRRRLETLVRKRGISEAVRFLGHRTDLPALLRSADLFTFASHREGTPRVVTEAMGAGCPVVATNVDGIPEQVVDGVSGWLVPAGDPIALGRAMEDALARPAEAKARAEKGLQRAPSFGVETMVRQLRAAYRAIETKAS